MVKSTVRFSETVMDRVEELVEGDKFSSKSEFQRFAVEYLLSEIDDYDPEMLDFNSLYNDVFPERTVIEQAEMVTGTKAKHQEYNEDFYTVASRVRQAVLRGDTEKAYKIIDTTYEPESPKAMFLDDIVQLYDTRTGTPSHR